MKSLKTIVLILIIILCFSSAKSQWTPCQGIEGARTADIMTRDSELFIITEGNGIFKRNLSQNAWDSACLAGGFLKIRFTENALFCFGPMTYFYRSMDDGASWIFNEEYSWVYDLEVSDSVVFIIYYGIVMRSLDEGASWMTVRPDSNSTEMSNLYAQPGQVFCSDYGSDTIFQSTDFGESWIKLPGNGSKGYINDIYYFDDEIWMATDTSIYIFNDVLNNWVRISDSLAVKAYPQNFFEFGNELFCCTNKGLYFFNVQDSAWHENNEGLESLDVSCGFTKGDTAFLATGTGPFYRIDGSQWISDYNDLFQLNVGQIFKIGSRIYANVQGKLFYSDDIDNGFEPFNSQGYCPGEVIITDSAWYEGSDCGFAISLDSGQTWTTYNEGIENHGVTSIAISEQYYFAEITQTYGLARTKIDSIAWERVPNELGNKYITDLEVINNTLFAVVSQYDYSLYKSDDYGTTFVAVPETGDYIRKLFVKNDKIFVLSQYDDIVYSNDLGETWNTWIYNAENVDFISIDMTDDENNTVLGGSPGPWISTNIIFLYSPGFQTGFDITDNLPPYLWSYLSEILIYNGGIFACPSSGGLWYRDDLMVGIKDNKPSNAASYSQLSIYPNPAKDIIRIHHNKIIEMAEYQVIDYSGKLIMKGTLQDGLTVHSVNISGIPKGIYLIMILDDKILTSGKFIKIN